MANCYVDMSHPMYGFNAQDKNDKIIIAINEEIRPCVRVKTSKYIGIDKGQIVQFARKDVPEDQLNCKPIKCLNTGTLYLKHAENAVKARFRIRSDARKYYNGFNMIYLKLPKAGSYTLKATVADYNDTEQLNAYVYTYTFSVGAPGYYLRTIDFTDSTVATQIGNGWHVNEIDPVTKLPRNDGRLAGELGVTLGYEVTYNPANDTDVLPALSQIGLSTISIVADRSELRKFSNVLLSCLTSFTHNVSTPASDARCFGRQYDPEQIEITKEITATTTSCNDYWLNPLQSVSKQMTSGVPVTDTFRVNEIEFQGKRYGTFVLPEMYYEDCNSIIVSSDRCACTYLNMLPVSPGISLEDDEFISVTLPNLGIERGTVLVNPMYIGEDLLITYNSERDVELIVANDKRLDKTHFRVTQHVKDTRGLDSYYVFNNVLITEISREFGTDGEITLQLSFTVSRDEKGNFYELRKSLEDIA